MTMLRTGEPGSCAATDGDVDIERDRALVLLAQGGDRSAFDNLYALYHRRVWRFCFKRLQDEHEAEDVVQEAFLRAWRALPGFGGDRRFYPWLSVIAAHLCTNVVRKRNRSDPAGDLHDQEALSWEHCGEDHVMAALDSELANRALARLSPRHRLVLDLRESRGWSYRRIAEHQGIGIPAVESLLWRAREALKREFSAQTGEGRLAGFAGVALLTIRRWLRSPQVAVQQGAGLFPTASSVLVSSAAAAVTVVAVGVGTLVPGLGSMGAGGSALSSPAGNPVSGAPSPLWSLTLAEAPGSTAWSGGSGPTMSAAADPVGAPTTVDPSGGGGTSPATSSPFDPSSPPVTPMSVNPQLPATPSTPPPPSPSVPTGPPALPQSPYVTDSTLPSLPSSTVESTLTTSTSGQLPSLSSGSTALLSTSPLPTSPTTTTGTLTAAVGSVG